MAFGAAVILHKRYDVGVFYIRKGFHVLVAIFLFGIINYISKSEFIIINIFFVIFFMVLELRKDKFLEPLDIKGKTNYGIILYPLGMCVMAIFLYSNLQYLGIGILILGIADSVASFVNFALKSSQKTYLSSFAFLVITALISFSNFSLPTSLLFGLILSVVERYSPRGSDNLLVPLSYLLLVSL